MSKDNNHGFKGIGLEIAAIFGKHFLKSQDLHFGYWPSELEVHILNLRTAHQNYVEFLLSHIPAGTKTILDVGCGTGSTAKQLVEMGYQVDCVSPSQFLTEEIRELLGNAHRVFECRYEELQTENRYDVILFSESLQYIRVGEVLDKTLGLLNGGGHLLICDFFKKDVEGKCLLGGGYKLAKFYDQIGQTSFELVKDIDITKETAVTVDMFDDILKKAARPSLDLGLDFLAKRHPMVSRFVRWKYKKRIEKIYSKYLCGESMGDDWRRYKCYRLFLYKKMAAKTAD